MRNFIKGAQGFSVLRFVLLVVFIPLASADMDVTEEARNDKVFLRQHNCFPEHFRLDKYLADVKYNEIIESSNRLEHAGYLNRYILQYKAHALYRLRKYEEAVRVLQQSMHVMYVCRLTAFRGPSL